MDAIQTVVKNGYTMKLYPDPDAEDPRVMFDFWSGGDVEHWRNGEVYGYVIEANYDPPQFSGDCLDSCWGFYGYSHAIQSATEQLDYFASLQPPLFEVA